MKTQIIIMNTFAAYYKFLSFCVIIKATFGTIDRKYHEEKLINGTMNRTALRKRSASAYMESSYYFSEGMSGGAAKVVPEEEDSKLFPIDVGSKDLSSFSEKNKNNLSSKATSKIKNKATNNARSKKRISSKKVGTHAALVSCEEICMITSNQETNETNGISSPSSYYAPIGRQSKGKGSTSQSKGKASYSSKTAKKYNKSKGYISIHLPTAGGSELKSSFRYNKTDPRSSSQRGSKKYHRQLTHKSGATRDPEKYYLTGMPSPLSKDYSSTLTKSERNHDIGYYNCCGEDGVSFLKLNLVGTVNRGAMYITHQQEANPSCERKGKMKYHRRSSTSSSRTKTSYLSHKTKGKGPKYDSMIIPSQGEEDNYLDNVRFIDCNDPCLYDNSITSCKSSQSNSINVEGDYQHHGVDICIASYDPISENIDFDRKMPDQVVIILKEKSADLITDNATSTTSGTSTAPVVEAEKVDQAFEQYYYHSIIQTTCKKHPIYPPFGIEMSLSSCEHNDDIRPFKIDKMLPTNSTNLTHPIIQFKGGMSPSFHYNYGRDYSSYSSFGVCKTSCNCTDMKKTEITTIENSSHQNSNSSSSLPTVMPSIETTSEITSLETPIPRPPSTNTSFCNNLCLEWIASNCLVLGDENTDQQPCISTDGGMLPYYYFNNRERNLFHTSTTNGDTYDGGDDDDDSQKMNYHKKMVDLIDQLLQSDAFFTNFIST